MMKTSCFSFNTIYEIIEYVANKYPNKIALTQDKRNVTYQELVILSNHLASQLINKTCNQKIRICIYFDKSIDAIISILAILKLGCTYIPLDPLYPKDRIQTMMMESKSRLVICTDKYISTFDNMDTDVFCFNRHELSGAHSEKSNEKSIINNVTVSENDTAYIIFTSGTTGKPKGVPITHRNVIQLLNSTDSLLKFSSQDVSTLFFSLAFDGSTLELYSSLLFGGRLIIIPYYMSRNPSAYYELIRSESVTFITQTPTAFKMLDEYESQLSDIPKLSLRLVIFGGEKLDFKSLQPWSERHKNETIRLMNLYGPSENTVVAAYHEMRKKDLTISESIIGKAIQGTSIQILNSQLTLVGQDEVGEIYLSGESLTTGYINDDDLNRNKFITLSGNKLYATGDLAKYNGEGLIEYIGRKDQQIKLNAYRIEPSDIESAVVNHLGVKSCYVKKHPDENKLIAYLEPDVTTQVYCDVKKKLTNHFNTYYRDLYNELYREKNNYTDDFHIIGWNSSFTQKQFTDAEMQEWIDETVKQIRAFKPKNILEIGFGTGLLLLRLYQECDYYCGIDYAESASQFVNSIIKSKDINNVELILGSGDEFHKIPKKKFDMIIINSVLICMPDIEYVNSLLDYYGKHHLTDDGVVFVGDIRNQDLSESFHTSVLASLSSGFSKQDLRQQAYQQMIRDKDLVVSPEYFHAFVYQSENYTHALTRLKMSHLDHELTVFRYDAILYKNPHKNRINMKWFEQDQSDIPKQIKTLLDAGYDTFGLKNIKNKRLDKYNQIKKLVCNELAEQGESELPASVHPAVLNELAVEYGYVMIADCNQSSSQGEFNAIFVKNNINNNARVPIVIDEKSSITFKPLYTYTNEYQKVICAYVLNNINGYLQTQLPSFMIPSEYLILKHFPQTSQGKVDSNALPIPDAIPYKPKIEIVLPRNETEDKLLNIWSNLFKIEKSQVSIHDKFYTLGGDSINAAKLMFLCKKEGIELNIQRILNNPCIAELSQDLIDKEGCAESQIENSDNDNSTDLPLLPIQVPYAIEFNISQIILYSLKPRYPFELEDLENICKTLVNRHDSLRVHFIKIADKWYQHVGEAVQDHVLEVVDYRALPVNSDFELLMRNHYENKVLLSMNMRNPRSAAKFIIYLLPTEQRFFFAINQYCTDLLSINIFWKELNILFNKNILPRLTQNYVTIINEMQRLISKISWDNIREFWLQQVTEAKPFKKSALPSDKSLPTVWKQIKVAGKPWVEKIIKKNALDIHLHDILLSAYVKCLCDSNNLDGISLLMLYHNRHFIDAMNYTLGAFAAPFPMYINHDSKKSDIEFIKQVKNTFNCIREQGIYFSFHFEEFMKHLMVNNNAGKFPTVAFNYLGGPDEFDHQIWQEIPEQTVGDLVTVKNNTVTYDNPDSKHKNIESETESSFGMSGGFMLLSKIISHKELQFTLIYDPNYYSDQYITEFTDRYLSLLKNYSMILSNNEEMCYF